MRMCQTPQILTVCLLALGLLAPLATAHANAAAATTTPPAGVTFFPPANIPECNANTALTWDGTGSVRCEKVIRANPTVGDPLFAKQLVFRGINNEVGWVCPDGNRTDCAVDERITTQGWNDSMWEALYQLYSNYGQKPRDDATVLADINTVYPGCEIKDEGSAAEVNRVGLNLDCLLWMCGGQNKIWPRFATSNGRCGKGNAHWTCGTGGRHAIIYVSCLNTLQ